MKLTGAQIIVKTLIEQGCDTVFGYPGGQILNVYDELYKHSDQIKHILTAHEQGATHAADGYYRSTGKVGVVISTSGPGATNLVTGIATAMLDSVPMVAITGNVPCNQIGKDSFQEVDITGITLHVTKHNYFVNDIALLASTIREAFCIAKSGRPGPVLIDVPKDIQMAEYEYEEEGILPLFKNNLATDAEILKAVKLINKSVKPYIFIGGGSAISNVGEQIIQLANKIDAFIGSTLMGLSVIPTSNNRFLGMSGMHGHYSSTKAQHSADLIIAIGTRFSDRSQYKKTAFNKNAKIIQLDIDFAEIEKNISVDVGICADTKNALTRIIKKVAKKTNKEWTTVVDGYKKEEQTHIYNAKTNSANLNPKYIFDVINSIKNDDDVIITDVGQHQMWTAQFIKLEKPRKFLTSGGLGTMGYGLGSAIGANIGSKFKSILITGDGSFGMNLNELATAVSNNVNVVIVILNNNVLGMVRQWQTLFFDKHYSNSTLNRKTDFVKLAEAFGLVGFKAENKEDFEIVFKKAYSTNAPTLIDCTIYEDEFVLPMMPAGKGIEGIIVKK